MSYGDAKEIKHLITRGKTYKYISLRPPTLSFTSSITFSTIPSFLTPKPSLHKNIANMRSYIILPVLATIVLGQSNSTATTTSANIAPTTGPCATVYDSCIAAGNGSPNIAECQASRANCVGASLTSSTANIAPTSGPCASVYDSCIAAGKGSPNIAECQASRANCVGTSLTSSIAANSTWGAVYTTKVVTAYTTFCPGATTLVHNGQTYTASASQTLTITNCPCTITTPVASATGKITSAAASGAGNGGAGNSGAATKTGSGNGGAATAADGASSPSGSNTPTEFEGAANRAAPAAGLLAAIGALVMI